MALSEYGFSQTYSNKIIDGVVGIVNEVELIQGYSTNWLYPAF